MLLKQVAEPVTLSREQPARGPIRPPCPVVDLVVFAGLAPRDFDDGLWQFRNRPRLPGTVPVATSSLPSGGSSRQPVRGPLARHQGCGHWNRADVAVAGSAYGTGLRVVGGSAAKRVAHSGPLRDSRHQRRASSARRWSGTHDGACVPSADVPAEPRWLPGRVVGAPADTATTRRLARARRRLSVSANRMRNGKWSYRIADRDVDLRRIANRQR